MRFFTAVILCVGLGCSAWGAPITTGSLIDEMTDMTALTYFPEPAYETVQFSSYDRRSSVPGGEHWFANADGFGMEPIPGFEREIRPPDGDTPGEYLICDVEGPGAIVRLWTATISGDVRVTLDDASAPLYEGPAEKFFRHPYDTFLADSAITPEVLAGSLYQRNAAYAPFPFAKRCKIVWIGNARKVHFYQVQIRKYAKETPVATFAPNDINVFADKIKKAASVLSDIEKNWTYVSQEAKPISLTVPAKTIDQGFKVEGTGAIERLVLNLKAHDLDKALRQTILHIQFDDAPWPQVQAPVGDFFGAGPGINPYVSVPFTVAPDGTMTCRYVMPYKRAMRILFDNRGDQDVSVSGSVLCSDYKWDDEASMYFRARWRVDHNLVASVHDEMGGQDLPFLIARGKGVYVGTAIMMLNPNNVPTIDGNWWGEGDEKIFVDDDVRPSTFGTGTEDYFNYAWSDPELFQFPYCGQPRNDGPANRGFVANYRWHILDRLPFDNSIAFYMELLNHGRTEGFSYARIAYHYGKEGLIDDHVNITDDDIQIPALPATWEPETWRGAKNWTIFASEALLQKAQNISYEEGPLWQGGRVLVWTPANEGETITFEFTLPEDDQYGIFMACKFQPDGGTLEAHVDGSPLEFEKKAQTRLVAPYHIQSKVIGTPGSFTAGKHQLTLVAQVAGKPIGIDFLAYSH